MKIDVNQAIWVKLSITGRRMKMRKHYEVLLASGRPDLEDYMLSFGDNTRGYYKTTLWEVLRDFGPEFRSGQPMPIEAVRLD